MKLTSFTDYSLRVLIYLAARPGSRATIGEIADTFGISSHHLTKVVHFLGRCGWLHNVRGKGGGLELAMAPAEIGVGDVVRATEGDARPAECFGEQAAACALTRACRLRSVLADAVTAFYAVLDEVTLADLVHNPKAISRLLFQPQRLESRA